MAKTGKRRFVVGAKVRVCNPGISGVVKHADDEPKSLGEYWHTVECHKRSGELYTRKEPGCNLELVPEPMGNPREPDLPRLITVHQYGHGARNYIDSADNSTNFVHDNAGELFQKIRDSIQTLITETGERQLLLERLEALEAAKGTPSWSDLYTRFMAVASDHVGVLTFILPHLVQLAAAAGHK